MTVEINPSVQKVIEFMQREIPADELNGVADSLPVVAKAIWSRFPTTEIKPMQLVEQPIAISR